MRYRDLVSFGPIVDIIQIREGDDKAIALQHVRSYVISEHMARVLQGVVFPQLQFETPRNNKNILIVGNYGTGKSHLMSVLAAITEHPEAVQLLTNPDLIPAAQSIAGRFKVWRTEIGGVTRSLRDIILDELEKALVSWGVTYSFPPADQLTSHKDVLIKAIGLLQEKHPGKGLLLVVDELLDYLRTRKEQDLILDLGFLRELGEVSALTPFRFVAGLQETLFDNPRFSFVNDQLRRVKDRFEQVRIVREDIAFVVSERLLKKDDRQKALIREHLARFQPLYPDLAERMDEFVHMFPVHPAYIEVIEDVRMVEKRQVLVTLSNAMQTLLDQDVPQDQPGMISFDQYWTVLRDNPSLLSLQTVSEVVDKSSVLESRVQNAFSRKHLLPVALRIVHALSVHRLTTDDIHTPLGMTAEELRDRLFPSIPLPEQTAQMLLDQVQVTLKEILHTVSGQYISYNEVNGQYYLDVKKDIDFEAKIQECGEFLDDDRLNTYFFEALRQVLGFSDTTYVTGAKIWFHELVWEERKVTRPGYFFFGAPDERSTAQPPRDFYVYFIPPFAPRQWRDEKRADEVIFQLKGFDQEFRAIVQRYAGASAMANDSPNHRQIYLDKADETLRNRLWPWLRKNLLDYLQVIHQGVEKPVRAVLPSMTSTETPQIGDLLNRAAAHLLAPAFQDRYPDYPSFDDVQQPITEASRRTAALEAIRAVTGRPTRLGKAVLHGLGLLTEDDSLRPQVSTYARHLLDLLHRKAENQVVPRAEVLEKVAESVSGPIYKDLRFRLETEWVFVLLAALVYNGDIVLTLEGNQTVDADKLDQYALAGLDALADFLHYTHPRSLPLSTWKDIFSQLSLAPALIQDETKRSQAVEELQKTVQAELERLATLEDSLQRGVSLWGEPLLASQRTYVSESGVVTPSDTPTAIPSPLEFQPAIRGYRKILDELAKINTVGKLSNLKVSPQDLKDLPGWRATIHCAEDLLAAASFLRPFTDYLSNAQAYLPDDHPWQERAESLRQRTLKTLRDLARGQAQPDAISTLQRELETLRKDYIAAYAELHRRHVLGPKTDKERQILYQSPQYHALKTLARIELLRQNADLLNAWEQAITDLRVCPEFHEGLLKDSAFCPKCRFDPRKLPGDQSAETRLRELENRLNRLLTDWQQALRAALTDESAQASLQAMTPAERQPVEAFLNAADDDPHLPDSLVESVNHALRGIQALQLRAEDLLAALRQGGLPCTVDEFRARFNRFLKDALRGHEEANTRLTLDQ